MQPFESTNNIALENLTFKRLISDRNKLLHHNKRTFLPIFLYFEKHTFPNIIENCVTQGAKTFLMSFDLCLNRLFGNIFH